MLSSPSSEYISRVTAAANAHGLTFSLVSAICEQESGWNPWAIRYEPHFFVEYILPLQQRGAIHTDTEARARSFSWGLMQLMGQAARERGYSGDLSRLCEPATGLYWGCMHFAAKMKAANQDITQALQMWNGGGNPNYAAEVLARLKNYLPK